MALTETQLSNLKIYTVPQSVYDGWVRDGTIDEDALYLTQGGMTGWKREIANKSVVIETTAWAENSTTSRFEAVLEDEAIRTDTDVDITLSDAQKGTYSLGALDPDNGSVTLYIDAVPEEPLVLRLAVTEIVE